MSSISDSSNTEPGNHFLVNEIFYDIPFFPHSLGFLCLTYDLTKVGVSSQTSSLDAADIMALHVEMATDDGDFAVATATEGPHSWREEYIALHCPSLWGGLLLPFLHSLFLDIVHFWGVPLAQFIHSSIRMIVAFIASCHFYRVPVSLELFRYFFVLEAPPPSSSSRGYLRLGPRHHIMGHVHSPEGEWRSQFFFALLLPNLMEGYPDWNLNRLFYNELPRTPPPPPLSLA